MCSDSINTVFSKNSKLNWFLEKDAALLKSAYLAKKKEICNEQKLFYKRFRDKVLISEINHAWFTGNMNEYQLMKGELLKEKDNTDPDLYRRMLRRAKTAPPGSRSSRAKTVTTANTKSSSIFITQLYTPRPFTSEVSDRRPTTAKTFVSLESTIDAARIPYNSSDLDHKLKARMEKFIGKTVADSWKKSDGDNELCKIHKSIVQSKNTREKIDALCEDIKEKAVTVPDYLGEQHLSELKQNKINTLLPTPDHLIRKHCGDLTRVPRSHTVRTLTFPEQT